MGVHEGHPMSSTTPLLDPSNQPLPVYFPHRADLALRTRAAAAASASQVSENGASHQIWVSSQIAQIWGLAPFGFLREDIGRRLSLARKPRLYCKLH
jgi:hypothetical protein